MKKLFLTLIMISTALFVQAQSLSTVRGKTRDGKTVEVKYYHGTISDQIESVQYQVVDELQARIKTLQSESKSLQQRLDAANTELKQLRKQANGGNSDEEGLLQEIAEKTATIESLNEQKANLNGELLQLEAQRLELQARYDSLLAKQQSLQDEKQTLEAEKQSLEAEKQSLLNQKQSKENKEQSQIPKPKPEPKVVVVQAGEKPEKTPVIGIELGMGPVFMGKCVDDSWAKDMKLGGRAAVYFGTPRLGESSPMSIEIGLGVRWFGMEAHQDMTYDTKECTDIDGHEYQAYFSTFDLKEKLTLTCLDIPIRLCFGQPAKDRVSAYFKIGVTPSINLLSGFNASGTYSLKGYYPQWDVTLEDIPELGFGSGDYHENATADISRLNLWGNAAFGVYVPFKGTHLLLNAGVKADYSILSIGTVGVGQYDGTPLRKAGLLNNGGRVFVPSVEVGLVYTIK